MGGEASGTISKLTLKDGKNVTIYWTEDEANAVVGTKE